MYLYIRLNILKSLYVAKRKIHLLNEIKVLIYEQLENKIEINKNLLIQNKKIKQNNIKIK